MTLGLCLPFLVELDFRNVGFIWGEGKTEVPGENLLEQRREPATHSTHIQCMASMLGFEPGLHWWEVRALTTAPPLFMLPLLLSNHSIEHNTCSTQPKEYNIIFSYYKAMDSWAMCNRVAMPYFQTDSQKTLNS